MKIWRCPNCSSGARAPDRLDHLDVRRWCLQCSRRTGKLVERTIPSKETEGRRRADARAAATAKRQERRAIAEAAAKSRVQDLASAFDREICDAADWLRAWAPRLVKLPSLRRAFAENYPDGRWAPTIVVRQGGTFRAEVPRAEAATFLRTVARTHPGACSYDPGSGDLVTITAGRQRASGHAYMARQRLVVTTGAFAADDLSTLVHELAHLAAPNREHHGPVFQLIQRDAVADLTGEEPVGWLRDGEDARVAVIQRWLDAQKKVPL
jgi:hypothetical protein